MKHLSLLFLLLLTQNVSAQILNIPAGNFKNVLVNGYCVDNDRDHTGDTDADTNNDGEIEVSEALAVTCLVFNNRAVTSFVGLEYFTNLQQFECSAAMETSLTLQNLPSLTYLNCSSNAALTTLNLQNLPNLTYLNCNGANLGTLDIQNFPLLQALHCSSINISSLSVAHLLALRTLNCSGNPIQTLNVQNCRQLQTLNCATNQLTTLNVQGLTNLKSLTCTGNQLTALNLQGLPNLEYIHCANNQLSALNLQNFVYLKNLYCDHNLLTTLQIQGTTSLLNLYCQNNLLTDLQIQNLGNLITVESSYNQLQTVNLAGAIHLTSLKCWYNQIVTLNTQGLVALETLEVLQNKMTNLNIANLPRLRYLHCESNLITTLSVTDCPFLRAISCTHNQISTLNLQNLAVFEDLSCASNQLTALNLSNIPSIRFLSCNRNQLTNLDFQYTPKIEYLSCGANLFTDLDVQSLHFLQSLQCSDSPITTIRMKNGINEGYFNCQNNPNLSYVCCDDAQLANVQTTLTQEGYTNVSVNSYCSFVPGSVFYTLQGNSKFDANSNGCDANDPLFPNMKYRIKGNGSTGFILANASGNYSIPIAAGTYTIKPVFENNYYTARPDSVQITFSSSTANTLTQDFCVPNTPHQDLEISILPTTAARPGFDANYQIVYKNKGTTLISDSLMLRFPDAIMDFVRANPAPSSMRHDTLVWYFQNLQAFETRTISLTLNLNSPMETPPVNAGDILTLQATIQPFDTDETREDNRFSLRQTVVGSLDPNDKTCLEGEQILPTQVGDYLHYLIRFENTGTFAAQNIVVKDTIDTLKFDIKTLEMTKASHDCRARILNNQQVEFIFENINLPFTAPDKYGFVAFKIKTKPNIPTGSTFENKADIFFDFNFPITTNTATTRIVNVLSTQKNPEQYPFGCSISPNPVTDILTIKTDINIEKAEICDALGRVIFTTSNCPNKQINVAHLPKGSYFIKIFSDNGSATAHFIR